MTISATANTTTARIRPSSHEGSLRCFSLIGTIVAVKFTAGTPRGPGRRPGPLEVGRSSGSGGQSLMDDADLDLACLGRLRDRDRDSEHAVVVTGFDSVGVEPLAQEELA